MTTAAYSDRDVEKIAWTVLIGSFVAFMLLLISAPLLAYWYLHTATDSHESNLTVLSGTVIVDMPGRDPTGEQKSRTVPEGATIRTDSNTRANLTLFDGSTVIIFPDTQVTISTIHSPKFSVSLLPLQMRLDLRSGRLRLDVVQGPRAPEFKVQTPQGEAQLQRGNYRVEVANDQTEVIVRDGQASVKARNESLTLGERERGEIKAGQLPHGPLTAERDLIVNGTFTAPPENMWRIYNDQGGDGGNIDGTVRVETDQSGRHIVHFTRSGSKGDHVDTGIEQILNADVTDAEVIRFHADVRVNYQSLSGGGYQSSEFPLMVRIKYRNIKGGETEWVHGFYYQNIENKPIFYGELVNHELWFPYESEDLTNSLDPKPAQIHSIQIYASGWDFDSMVTDVGLTVE